MKLEPLEVGEQPPDVQNGVAVIEHNNSQEGERKAFLRMYLSKRSKKLSEKQELTIAAAHQAGNPRFLQVLLDDISVFGDFEKLDNRIRTNLKAQVNSHSILQGIHWG